jgi:hypothetical protein
MSSWRTDIGVQAGEHVLWKALTTCLIKPRLSDAVQNALVSGVPGGHLTSDLVFLLKRICHFTDGADMAVSKWTSSREFSKKDMPVHVK